MTNRKKSILMLILYQSAFLPIIGIALLRKEPFLKYYEDFNPLTNLVLVLSIVACLIFYIYIITRQGVLELSIKTLLKLISPLLFFMVVAPPVFSRDILAYLIPARNLVVYGRDPYTTQIQDFDTNSWTVYAKAKYRGTSIYGPLFNVFMAAFFAMKTNSIYFYTLLYKIFVFGLFLLDIVILKRITSQLSISKNTVGLFILNPSILIHLVLDAHNDALIITLILATIYFFNSNKLFKSFSLLMLSIGIKYISLFLLPAFCFNKGRLVLKNVLVLCITFLCVIIPSLFIFPSFFHRFITVSSTNFTYTCLYACAPTVVFYRLIFGSMFIEPLQITFLIIWLFALYYFILRKDDIFAYITAVFMAFNFFGLLWITPWAYIYPIVGSGILFSRGRFYSIIFIVLTCYSLLHYFGI